MGSCCFLARWHFQKNGENILYIFVIILFVFNLNNINISERPFLSSSVLIDGWVGGYVVVGVGWQVMELRYTLGWLWLCCESRHFSNKVRYIQWNSLRIILLSQIRLFHKLWVRCLASFLLQCIKNPNHKKNYTDEHFHLNKKTPSSTTV